jgi:hypothetical protein
MRLQLSVFAAFVAVGLAAFLGAQAGTAEEEEQSGKTLRHIVLYKFKDDLKPEQVQEVVDAFAALPKKIDAIVDFEHGTNVSTENKSEGLTHCFVVSFKDQSGLADYLKHPAHQEYVEVVRDRREKVIVFDYWTAE